jgi:hypothetical protein
MVAIVWSLWPTTWSAGMALWAGLAALVAVVGLGILLSAPVRMRPDQIKEREAPGHVGPPVWNWRAVGLLCLVAGWAVLSLGLSTPVRVDTSVQWACHLGGIVCLLVAVVVGLRPRVGSVQLVDRVPRVPTPLAGGIAGPAVASDSIREVTAMTQWLGRLTLEPMQALQRGHTDEAPRNREVLFDLIATDWDRQLARAFRKALRDKSKESLHDFALEPRAWASCVVGQLQRPDTSCSDLGVVLVAQGVRAWIESLTLKELIGHLDLDLGRFGTLVARVASANWPATRVEPDMSVGVVAMGKGMWEALGPGIQAEGVCAVIRCDGGGSDDGISVLRFVQGLSQGWRGFPAIANQQSDQSAPDPARSGQADHRGTAPIP